MIQGLLKRKTKMNVEIKEDSLTSSVFGTILLLPSELIWKILYNSSFDRSLPLSSGEIKEYEFWPRWDSKNTSNSRFVEPDLFIRFENFDVLIEAKRWEKNQQYKMQWIHQCQAYKNEYVDNENLDEDRQRLIYFAVGGLRNEQTENVLNEFDIYKIKWGRILNEVSRLKEELENYEYHTSQSWSIIRITETIIKSFELHKYFTGKWLESIPIANLEMESSSKVLLNWKPNE